jgi:tripartite ATP-independent transporter DctP family solute receptor
MPNRALLAALGGALLLSTAAAQAQVQLRIAGNFPEDHTATGAMEIFKEEVEKITDGGIQVDLFPAMQLGGAQENVDQVRSGAIFGVFTSIAYFSRSVPEYEAVSLPFLFDSREQAFALMDGEVGDYLDAKMAEEGFVNLGYMELGFRHVTNDVRPIETMADFEGLKIRLQPNEVHLDSMRAVGANPTPMDISEVYSALQQGVLDGQENPYNIIATRGFDEVQTYLSDSGHFFDFINAVANQERFEELSAEHQEAVREAMRTAVLWQREQAAAQEERFREVLIERGMTFTPISDEVRAELREATSGVVDGLRARIGDEPIDLVLANMGS